MESVSFFILITSRRCREYILGMIRHPIKSRCLRYLISSKGWCRMRRLIKCMILLKRLLGKLVECLEENEVVCIMLRP